MSTYVTVGGGPVVHPVLWLVAVGLSLIGALPTAGATIWVISEAYLGREATIGDALQYALGKFMRILIAGLAKGLVIALPLGPFVVSFAALFTPGVATAPVLIAFVVISVLVGFPMAVVVWVGYAIVTQAVVLEELPRATDALGRSWHLTKGYKGKAFALGFVVFALIYVPFIAASAIAAFIPGLTTTVEIGAELVWLMIYPIVACAFTLLYYDLRVRKEAFDLEHLSQQLGIEVESAGA